MISNSALNEPPASGMSMREKSAWISLATTVAVYVPYFAYIYRLLSAGQFETSPVFVQLITATVLQSVLSALGALVFLVRQRKEPRNERDTAIESRSYRSAYHFLATSCFLLVLSVWLMTLHSLGAQTEWSITAKLASQAVLFCFVGAEIVKYLTLAIGYRRTI